MSTSRHTLEWSEWTELVHDSTVLVFSFQRVAVGGVKRKVYWNVAAKGWIGTIEYKKASIRWHDSAPPISGYWPTSEPNAGDHDFPLTGSNFGNLTAFRAIFSHIFTAHAQERPFMNFWLKFWHHHSLIPISLLYRARYISAIRGRFLLIFALDKLNVRHISTSGLVDLLT